MHYKSSIFVKSSIPDSATTNLWCLHMGAAY